MVLAGCQMDGARKHWLQQNIVANPELPQKLTEYVKGFWQHLYVNGEIVKENSAVAQAKLKCLYDRKAVVHRFSPGVQVLALMPIISTPFQFKFHSPFIFAPGF